MFRSEKISRNMIMISSCVANRTQDKLPEKVRRSLRSSRVTDESYGNEMERSNPNKSGNEKEGNSTNETEIKTSNKYIVMTPMEAEGAIMNARKFDYTLKWDQHHTKGGWEIWT